MSCAVQYTLCRKLLPNFKPGQTAGWRRKQHLPNNMMSLVHLGEEQKNLDCSGYRWGHSLKLIDRGYIQSDSLIHFQQNPMAKLWCKHWACQTSFPKSSAHTSLFRSSQTLPVTLLGKFWSAIQTWAPSVVGIERRKIGWWVKIFFIKRLRLEKQIN